MDLNNKGFTLIELLAVIVVLAIIALIGFFSIGNVIESSQEKSDKLSIRNYVKAIEKSYMEKILVDSNYFNGVNSISAKIIQNPSNFKQLNICPNPSCTNPVVLNVNYEGSPIYLTDNEGDISIIKDGMVVRLYAKVDDSETAYGYFWRETDLFVVTPSE